MKRSQPVVRLTRTVAFSSGHRYWQNVLDQTGNRALYGAFASPYNHGHNYRLEVTIQGRIDPLDGMVMNIKDIDGLLKTRVVSLLDGKSLNDEVPPFTSTPPTTENLALCVWNLICGKSIRLAHGYSREWRWDADLIQDSPFPEKLPDHCFLVKLRLEEMPGFYVELESRPERNLMTLTRTYEFAASHRLHVPSMSDAENENLFGKCNNRAGHGHNYVLEVTVEGEPEKDSGMLVDLSLMDQRVMTRVVDRYDHKNFNEDIPEFKGVNPTSELVAAKIFELLEGHLPANLYRIRLHETARNCFEVCRS